MSNFGANEDCSVATTLSHPFSANSWKTLTGWHLHTTVLTSQVLMESTVLPVHDDLSLKILVRSLYTSHSTEIVGSLGISWYKFLSSCLFSRLNLVNKLLVRKNRHECVFHMQPYSVNFKKIKAEYPCSGLVETLWMSFSSGIDSPAHSFLKPDSSQHSSKEMCALDTEIHPYVVKKKKSAPGHWRLLRNFGCSSPLGKSVSPPIFGPFFS